MATAGEKPKLQQFLSELYVLMGDRFLLLSCTNDEEKAKAGGGGGGDGRGRAASIVSLCQRYNFMLMLHISTFS